MNTPQITGTEKVTFSDVRAEDQVIHPETGEVVTIARVMITGKKAKTVSLYPHAETSTNVPMHGTHGSTIEKVAPAPALVECRECGGTGVIPAGIDREAGRDPGRDCWKCHGYGEHIR